PRENRPHEQHQKRNGQSIAAWNQRRPDQKSCSNGCNEELRGDQHGGHADFVGVENRHLSRGAGVEPATGRMASLRSSTYASAARRTPNGVRANRSSEMPRLPDARGLPAAASAASAHWQIGALSEMQWRFEKWIATSRMGLMSLPITSIPAAQAST